MAGVKNTIIYLTVLFLLTSCTTKEANEALILKFVGTPTDQFFIQYGPPSQTYVLDSGGKIYLWSEIPTNYTVGGTSSSTVNVVGGTAYVNTTSTPASTYSVQCTVKIIGNTEGIITQIIAHHDTVGNWQLSRCNEVFNRKNVTQ